METTKILSASFLDILFDGRNKEYGAYELRTTYGKRIVLALGVTCGLVVSIAGGLYWNALHTQSAIRGKVNIITTTITAIDEPKKVELPAPAPPKLSEPKKIEAIKFVIPKIVEDKLVTEIPPSNSELENVKIATANVKGEKMGDIVTPPLGLGDNKGVLEVKAADQEPDIFLKVEKEAEYPGGTNAWRNFLERNLRGNDPVEKGAQPGTYKVIVKFVVDTDGTVSGLQALTKIGFGMEEEAIRVIRKSGKWRPAIQNGHEVKAYRSQPIIFQVLDQ